MALLSNAAALAKTTAQVSVTTSVTETDLITATLATGTLAVGTTFRIRVRGTLQTQATSGILTFRFYLATVAASATLVLPTQVALGPFFVQVEADLTVRSIGGTGTYVCTPMGLWQGSATAILPIPPGTIANVNATNTINTAATTPIVKATAQWATSSATNSLKIETGTIERINP